MKRFFNKKKLGVLLVLGLSILFFSCNKITDSNAENKLPDYSVEFAMEQIELAQAEAMDYLDYKFGNIKTPDFDPENPSTWNPKEQILNTAFECADDGDYTAFTEILDKYGVTKDLLAIAQKYDIDNCNDVCSASLRKHARSITATDFSSLRTGDILLCCPGSSNSSSSSSSSSSGSSGSSAGSSNTIMNLCIPGHFKHAGIFDKREYKRQNDSSQYVVLSASGNTNLANTGSSGGTKKCVGWESIARWADPDIDVCVVRVKDTSDTECEAALNEGKKYIGTKYLLGVDKNGTYSFYCSKLVYRCWKQQGYDLSRKISVYVYPQDLYDSSKTMYVFGDDY